MGGGEEGGDGSDIYVIKFNPKYHKQKKGIYWLSYLSHLCISVETGFYRARSKGSSHCSCDSHGSLWFIIVWWSLRYLRFQFSHLSNLTGKDSSTPSFWISSQRSALLDFSWPYACSRSQTTCRWGTVFDSPVKTTGDGIGMWKEPSEKSGQGKICPQWSKRFGMIWEEALDWGNE